MVGPIAQRDADAQGWFPLLATLAVVAVCYACLVTYGSFELLGPELRGSAFDSLGQSLLDGRADVDTDTINWEGFAIDGRTYMYQGPFPALVRIPLNAVYPAGYGEWSRVSCLMGALLAVLVVGLVARACLRDRPRRGVVPLVTTVLAFALGSPLVYLISNARIYNESIIWGLCFAVWFLWFSLPVFRGERLSAAAAVGLSVCAAGALLSRITFGLPLFAIVAALVLHELVARRPLKVLAGLLAPALAGGLFQLWYNHARFGSVLETFDLSHHYLGSQDLHGFFNVARIPTGLYNFLWPRSSQVSFHAPWFEQVTVFYRDPTLYMHWREQTISLLTSSPFLSALGFLGVFLDFRRRAAPRLARLAVLAFAAQALLICAYGFLSQRFAAELLPLLAAGLCATILYSRLRLRPAILVGLCAFSIAASVLSTASWHLYYAAPGVDIPASYQQGLRDVLLPQHRPETWRGSRWYLTVEDALDVVSGFLPPRTNATFGGVTPLTVLGRRVAHGIGFHAPTTMEFRVPENAVALEAVPALGDSALSCYGALYRLRITDAVGALSFESGPIGMAGAPLPGGSLLGSTYRPRPFRVPVVPGTLLRIEADPLGSRDCDHGVLAEAAFLIDASAAHGGRDALAGIF